MSPSASRVRPLKKGTRASCSSRSVIGASGGTKGMADTTGQRVRRRAAKWEPRSMRVVDGHPALGIERGHAAATGRRDGLPVREVLHVATGEDARHVRVGAPRPRLDVAVVVQLELALEEVGV